MKQIQNNKNWLKITKINTSSNTIEILFAYSSGLSRFFRNENMRIEYSSVVSNTPTSIAVVPLVCNVLPIIWLTDSILYINELDADFYHCINDLKNGYKDIYPDLSFNGNIVVGQTIQNHIDNQTGNPVCLFSGGVDATATMLHHYDETPSLAYILGADIRLSDSDSWKPMRLQLCSIAEQMGLEFMWIASNFREIINEEELCCYLSSLNCRDDWWHGFQHGIGLIGHLAPLCPSNGINKIYIASSYTIRERGTTTCASDPRIDNFLRFCGTSVVHDFFELSRQQKIEYIVKSKQTIGQKAVFPLHVCWENHDNKNCGKCEKCYRTFFGILAEKASPTEYGLQLSLKNQLLSSIRLLLFIDISPNVIPLWADIKSRIRENYNLYNTPPF